MVDNVNCAILGAHHQLFMASPLCHFAVHFTEIFAAALPHVMSIITLQAILENIPLVLNGRGWYSTAKE